MSAEIRFDDEHRKFAAEVAHIRSLGKDPLNITKVCSKENFEISYLGILAELAAAQFLKTKIDVNHYQFGDPGFDLILGKNILVDIKYSFRSYGDLYFRKKDLPFKADIYVLICGSPSIMKLKGYATPWLFENFGVTKDYGNRGKPVLALQQKKLFPVSNLLKYC